MSEVRIVGTETIAEGRVRWNFAEKITASKKFVGLYTSLFAMRPRRGQVLPDFPQLRVVSYVLDEMEGGTGEMDVNYELSNSDPGESGFEPRPDADPIAPPIYEIIFNQERAALWSHPLCGKVKDSAPVDVTIDAWEKLRGHPEWYQVREIDDAWSLTDYIELREDGIEDYYINAPTIRRTLYYTVVPTDIGSGTSQRETPPIGVFDEVNRYDWMRATDSLVWEGIKLTRTTEWIAADKRAGGEGWNSKIYTWIGD